MPPELLSGKPFSKAVDVYMFGVLLWEVRAFLHIRGKSIFTHVIVSLS